MTRILLVPMFVALLQVPAAAQTPATPAAAPTPGKAPSAAPAKADVVEPRGFDYNAEGRRDPFVSLLGRGMAATDRTTQGPRPAGLGGLDTAEVSLKGTMLMGSGTVAMLQGADGRTYVVRAGDKLRDGAVRAITQNALVIVQQVNDPLSLEKQREVRKTIRQTDEAK